MLRPMTMATPSEFVNRVFIVGFQLFASTDASIGGLFRTTLRRTTNVECPHRQLCSRFTNRLCGHNTHSLTDIDLCPTGQVTTVTFRTNPSTCFTGQDERTTTLGQYLRLQFLRPVASSTTVFAGNDNTSPVSGINHVSNRHTTQQYALPSDTTHRAIQSRRLL
jgi:hypothetical protein